MINILEEILYERYKECDIKEHLKPNSDATFCNYCYRNLTDENIDNFNSGLKKLAEEIVIKLSIIG